jgi:hypothetical protein
MNSRKEGKAVKDFEAVKKENLLSSALGQPNEPEKNQE